MDDLLNDMTNRLQRRLRGRRSRRQESFVTPSGGYQWSYRWSSNSASGQPAAQITSLQQQQGQPSSSHSLAVSAPHQNQPQTSTFPEIPLRFQTPAQQTEPPIQNHPSKNQLPPPHTSPSSFSSSSKPPKHSTTTCLTLHNNPRSAQNIPPLQWSDTLHHDAQQYAERLARKGKMEHSSRLGESGQGENLYASSDRKAGVREAVGAWMGEGKWYPEGANVRSAGGGGLGRWGHYSQCMWSGTTHVGMGKAVGRDGWVYVVARYWPAGNVLGQRPY